MTVRSRFLPHRVTLTDPGRVTDAAGNPDQLSYELEDGATVRSCVPAYVQAPNVNSIAAELTVAGRDAVRYDATLFTNAEVGPLTRVTFGGQVFEVDGGSVGWGVTPSGPGHTEVLLRRVEG